MRAPEADLSSEPLHIDIFSSVPQPEAERLRALGKSLRLHSAFLQVRKNSNVVGHKGIESISLIRSPANVGLKRERRIIQRHG